MFSVNNEEELILDINNNEQASQTKSYTSSKNGLPIKEDHMPLHLKQKSLWLRRFTNNDSSPFVVVRGISLYT